MSTLKTTNIQEPSAVSAAITLDSSGNTAINGSLTIGGIAAVTTSGTQTLTNKTINASQLIDATISASKLDGGQSGAQPIFANRAWVYFSGTTISNSGNVSSVATSGTNRQVNFTTSMPDANFAAQVSSSAETNHWISARATGSVSVGFGNTTYTNVSVEVVR